MISVPHLRFDSHLPPASKSGSTTSNAGGALRVASARGSSVRSSSQTPRSRHSGSDSDRQALIQLRALERQLQRSARTKTNLSELEQQLRVEREAKQDAEKQCAVAERDLYEVLTSLRQSGIFRCANMGDEEQPFAVGADFHCNVTRVLTKYINCAADSKTARR